MIIDSVNLKSFRNISAAYIFPDPHLNILVGENAQGKTNLFEALWLFTGCRSFRSSKERDFVRIGDDFTRVELCLKTDERPKKFVYVYSKISGETKSKHVEINGVEVNKNATLFENFKCIIFTPEDMCLSKGAPDKRRSFLDMCLSQLKPRYLSYINRYSSVLSQRNAILKEQHGRARQAELVVWDEQLAKLGAYITIMRKRYISRLNSVCARLYAQISGGEKLVLSYRSSVEGKNPPDSEKELESFYFDRLFESIDTDRKLGFTTVGVHRDDICFEIDGLNSRDFASQGQNRSIAVCMKLAQAIIYSQESDEFPIILLDDVFSELDTLHRRFILEMVEDMQVFISSCEAAEVLKYKKGKVFNVTKGEYNVYE